MPEISYTRVNDNTPVLVGCAQLTDKRGVEGYNYLEILTEVSKKALIDCEASKVCSRHTSKGFCNIRSMGLPKYAEESCEVAWLQCKK